MQIYTLAVMTHCGLHVSQFCSKLIKLQVSTRRTTPFTKIMYSLLEKKKTFYFTSNASRKSTGSLPAACAVMIDWHMGVRMDMPRAPLSRNVLFKAVATEEHLRKHCCGSTEMFLKKFLGNNNKIFPRQIAQMLKRFIKNVQQSFVVWVGLVLVFI